MRTAAYCRFSSDQQREASIRDQFRNIEVYCERHGWPTPALYQDQAISGSRNDRPGYQSMLSAAEVGAFDVLLVDDLSRLSRDHIESAQAIRKLKYIGVRVIGISDGTDTARDGYKLETGLRGLMSEMYLDDLAKKTHRGLMGQALDGYSAGGLPYGYTSSFDGSGHKRAINDDQAQWVHYIFERYAMGDSPRTIADQLNSMKVTSPRGGTWAHTAIYPDRKGVGMLANQIYNGKQVWNKTAWVKDPETGRRRRLMRPQSEWVIIDSPELKIIDDDLWAACQGRTKEQKRDTMRKSVVGKNSGGRGPKYLFSGLLRCGHCGSPYTIIGRDYYGCSGRKDRGESVCNNRLTVRKSTVEMILLKEVRESMLSDQMFAEFEAAARKALKEGRPDTTETRRRLASAKREVENIMAAIRAGILTASTRDALQSAEEQAREAEEEMRAAEAYEPAQLLPRAREIYRTMVEKIEEVEDVTAAREALRALIGEVRLIPENGSLTAEIQSAGLAGALQISLVAGARFGRYLTAPNVIRIPGLK